MKTYLKRNKPLLFLPLVLIPFIVLIFYILGGGENPKGKDQRQTRQDTIKGANYDLPDADHSLEILDKTELSQSPDEITLSRDYNILGDRNNPGEIAIDSLDRVGDVEPGTSPGDPENLLKHIQQREKQIRSELEGGQTEKSRQRAKVPQVKHHSKPATKEIPETGADAANQSFPVSGIEELDRVFRQNQRLARQNDSLKIQMEQANAFRHKLEAERSRSFTLEKGQPSAFEPAEPSSSLLKAEVYETTTVLTGNRVKLRLLEEASVNGTTIPAGTFIYGICEVANERLRISVRQLPVGDSFIPVELNIYDLDGLAGLYVPDNAARKVAKEVGSSTNTSSMFGVTGNPLTYAGVQAADRTAQSLLRMVRLKKVTIKKNTLVYLINHSK
ncbi:MAG: conjugative transposon protein TraM [Mangrovibacterium sp.]|tara:strand:- start:2517 stop:3680 length:1164 start_codon:yes stop_codon:yes gene_type:complete